jgi:limonene 1,2-monooxygenase
VAAVASPTAPRPAGKHGIGLLSIGATLNIEGLDALAYHWASSKSVPRPSASRSANFSPSIT